MEPDQYLAKMVDWQFFATLTFAAKIPTESNRNKMFHAWASWLDQLEKAKGSNRHTRRPSPHHAFYWMLREELGEIGGRLHYHVLIGGLSKNLVNTRTAMASCAKWEKLHGGMARNYVYDSHLDGVGYVLKGLDQQAIASKIGAIDYEMGKFVGAEGRRVLLGHSLTWKLLNRTSNKRLVKARVMRALNRGS